MTELEKAKQDLVDFLEKNPAMNEKQKELDAVLGTMWDPIDKLNYLFMEIGEEMNKMGKCFSEISSIAKKINR
jgi:uncharacterized coiled-coil DUF342 family protein